MSREDISNRSLALLVGVAIVVSLVGILSVKQPEVIYSTLTGFAIDQNTTLSATVTRDVAISVSGAIAFGSGVVYMNNSGEAIVLNTTAIGGGPSSAICANQNTSFNGASCTFQDDGDNRLLVVNDGNVNVTVIMGINSTLTGLGLGLSGDIGFAVGQHESISSNCPGPTCSIRPACISIGGFTQQTDATAIPGQIPNNTGFRVMNLTAGLNGRVNSIYSVAGLAITGQTVNICEKLGPDDLRDAINVTFYVNISKTVPIGTKNFLLNFTAYDRFTSEN